MTRKSATLPRLSGPIGALLGSSEARNERGALPDGPAHFAIRHPEQVTAMALGVLVLEHLRPGARPRVSTSHLRDLVQEVLEAFGEEERLELELEAHAVLEWFASAADPDYARAPLHAPALVTPRSAHDEVMRWAIVYGHDLILDVFELDQVATRKHVVTPLVVHSGTYLRGFCHDSGSERIFRASRISEVMPVGGWPEPSPERDDDADDSSRGQMNIFDTD
ncbi:MAG: hypothetical protein AAGI01_05965 [Myxococcota bacterium]